MSCIIYTFCILVLSLTAPGDCGVLKERTIRNTINLALADSPWKVPADVTVESDGQLTIEPGVEVLFSPTVGITVKGALIAKGTSDKRIVFTGSQSSTEGGVSISSKVRLVDGASVMEGRVQIFHKGKWRSVCTNSKNWTDMDLNVVCFQLGFSRGYVYHWFGRPNNDSSQLLYATPNCTGDEAEITDCPNWNERQLGSGVCDYHLDIGVRCAPMLQNDTSHHWRGILFQNAKATQRKLNNLPMDRWDSSSSLEYVTIKYAGRNSDGGATSAIEIIGNPPTLIGLEVRWNAFNALNFTEPREGVNVEKSVIAENRGYGIYINSSTGRGLLTDIELYGNGGDGVRYVFHDNQVTSQKEFCKYGDLGMNEVYPLFLTHKQERDMVHNLKCRRVFKVAHYQGQQVTVHFSSMETDELDENKAATISVYDSQVEDSKKLLAKFKVLNNTGTQSFTSTKGSIFVHYEPINERMVFFSVEVVVDFGKSQDMKIVGCNITGNNGRGVAVENIRSGISLKDTHISYNSYVAGLHVLYGAGDVVINNSVISHNSRDGVNVSYSGGFRHFNQSIIQSNEGSAVVVWINETSNRLAFNFTSHFTFLHVLQNGEFGLLLGNVCRADSFVNISTNSFQGNKEAAVKFLSCWDLQNTHKATLLVNHNNFGSSSRLALHLAPAFHVEAVVSYNLFTEHETGTILVSNRHLEGYETVETKVEIVYNTFEKNKGCYVANIGLLDGASLQELIFSKNILKDNHIIELFPALKPRSRVAAVVAVSSSNTKVVRNHLENPLSTYEMGSHLESNRNAINASLNYWGSYTKNQVRELYDRIFDRKNRYNIAPIEFLQFLLYPNLEGDEIISNVDEVDKITWYKDDNNIGGEVRGHERLSPGTYQVHKDIFVKRDSSLKIEPGVVLNFQQSIGMMVQGKLECIGSNTQKINFKLSETNQFSPYIRFSNKTEFTKNTKSSKIQSSRVKERTSTKNTKAETYNGLNSTVNAKNSKVQFSVEAKGKRNSRNDKVRLSNGMEGRLEVQINKQWGSVCLYGWDMEDAAVACHQMGLVLHPQDWLLEKSLFVDPYDQMKVLLSNVQCTELDTDVTTCKAEGPEDMENSCTLAVGMKCYQATWSGIRIGMAAMESYLEHVVVEGAGLLDYTTHAFRPAVQADLYHHSFKYMSIHSNTDSGLGLMWNDIFHSKSNQKISDSEFRNNGLHGIITRSQGIDIKNNIFAYNQESGIHYDPVFEKLQHRDLLSWIDPPKDQRVTSIERGKDIEITGAEKKYMFIDPLLFPDDITFQLRTDSGRRIGILVLNPISTESSEEVMIYGASEPRDDVPYWDLKKNLTSFPLRSPGSILTVRYKKNNTPVGTAILLLSSVEVDIDFNSDMVYKDENLFIRIHSNKIDSCGKGISSNHYNRDLSEHGDHFNRYNNETLLITDNEVSGSKKGILHVITPFWDPLISTLAEINYTLVNNAFTKNEGGIVQYSRDIRNSNNLFHWVVNDTRFEGNLAGGINIRLPYVSHYNENYTHSFVMHNSSFEKNDKFDFLIDGHFARINMSTNKWLENNCKLGLLSVSGMEKEMNIQNNKLEENICHFVVQFQIQSHSDKFGVVKAVFEKNILKNNKDNQDGFTTGTYHPASYALAMRGVQQVNITRNILSNPSLQFEFLAGVRTGSVDNTLNVAQNWWGTTNVTEIREKIFDFDDWNSFAVADFSPFLGRESIDAGGTPADIKDTSIDIDKAFGGRLYKSLTLKSRSKPYVIKSDLTVMPGVKLTIQPGVLLEFYPSVGLLVLGELDAKGTRSVPIEMRPAKMVDSTLRFRRQVGSPNVRLCVSPTCGKTRRDGFLEIFNTTTSQWSPVCDPRFTERNAEVVCNELGYSRLNVYMKRGRRYDYGPTEIGKVRSWPYPLECTGEENFLQDCEKRLNGYGEHMYSCSYEGDYVFIFCGEDNIEDTKEHWGGIRFSNSNFEFTKTGIQDPSQLPASKLEHVRITGAGVLHGQKSGALQAVLRDIDMYDVTVSHSSSHGIELISPPSNICMNKSVVQDNLGVGINFVTLSGESSESEDLSYNPLQIVNIPYHIFGMVDICDTNKELKVEERLLVYYKYDNRPVDCIKIFISSHSAKPIGFRLLQSHLFNATQYTPQSDAIYLHDGDIFNFTIPLLGKVTIGQSKTEGDSKFYRSSGDTLSVQLHATGASEVHGFIAEVVTLPFASYNVHNLYHNITQSKLKNNQQGALSYRSAGESTPRITLSYNRFENNGLELFGNFTTSDSAVLLNVQNLQDLEFHNNLIRNNQGGLHLVVDAKYAVASLNGRIINNLFLGNKNREALLTQGGDTGSYQLVHLHNNYFTHNYALYRDNIVLAQVKANVSRNTVVDNVGFHQVRMEGFEGIGISPQVCVSNWFWNNRATELHEQSTILAMHAGQHYENNYLVNPESDFEMSAFNRSLPKEQRESPIVAINNWWGFNKSSAVASRIKDSKDLEDLLEIQFEPFHMTNSSVLSGKCAGGWQVIKDTCFLYVGGTMTYSEARDFCQLNNASMPFEKQNRRQLQEFIRSQQLYFEWDIHRVWVQAIDIPISQCAVLYREKVYSHPCDDSLPFLCERDPNILVSIQYWYTSVIGTAFVSVMTAMSFLVILLALCALWKSRHRLQEKKRRQDKLHTGLGHARRSERRTKVPTSNKQQVKVNNLDSLEREPTTKFLDENKFVIYETRNPALDSDDSDDYGSFTDSKVESEATDSIVPISPTYWAYGEPFPFDQLKQHSTNNGSESWSNSTASTLELKRAASKSPIENRRENLYDIPSVKSSHYGSRQSNLSNKPTLETSI
ncbi:protein bark beetle-like [Limulus polyphemus]|uniref:Protein bark beetle-like n=1 Tax=Limulus polyphemus TaxID=6850 RepID=A0ABM1BG70_LIMPO|nr:protein bark beetle-like [Limulus polyphemus]